VFASVSDPASVAQTRDGLQSALGVDIQTSQVVIRGTNWTRLHSNVMAESTARALVANAEGKGYSAWYNGSGGSLVSSSSAVAVEQSKPVGALTEQPYSRGESGYESPTRWSTNEAVVTPASDDLSHLPMAETFPLDDS